MAPTLTDIHASLRRGTLPAALGLGIAIMLYGLVVWSPAALFSYDRAPVFVHAGYAASLANATAFLLAAVRSGLRGKALAPAPHAACAPDARTPRPTLPVSAAALAVVASAALWAAALGCSAGTAPSGPPFAGLLFAAGVVSGVAVALAFLHWLRRLAVLDAQAARAALVLAAAASALLNLPTGFVSAAALRILVFGLLAAEAALLATDLRASRQGRADGVDAELVGHAGAATSGGPVGTASSAAPVLRAAAGDLGPVLVAAIVVTFVAPLVNTVLMVDVLALPWRLGISAVMNLVAALFLAGAWFLPRRPPSTFALLLGFTLVLFAAVVLSWLAGPGSNPAVLALGSAGFFLVTYLVMDASLAAARDRGVDLALAYGAAAGIVMCARVGADVFAAWLLNAGIASESKVLAAAFLLVYLLTCAAFSLWGALSRHRLAQRQQAQGKGGANGLADGNAAGAGAAVPSAAASPADLGGWALLAARCEQVSSAYSLSQREREVLTLMMKGRNVPAIAEELVLSRNTVQTHVRHLYEQLGVHSRKDLVAFVEAFKG